MGSEGLAEGFERLPERSEGLPEGPEGQPGGLRACQEAQGGRTDGWTGGRIDVRMYGISSHSTELLPLFGSLPIKGRCRGDGSKVEYSLTSFCRKWKRQRGDEEELNQRWRIF